MKTEQTTVVYAQWDRLTSCDVIKPVLSDITQNEFTVKDFFTFVDEILTQNSDFIWLVWMLMLCLPTSN